MAETTFSRESFEETMYRPIEFSNLEDEVIIGFMDIGRQKQIRTCPGDIYKIVNALMDYSRILEMVIKEWGIEGYRKAVYELHAENLRAIAKKYSDGVGYDYQKALEKCEKLRAKQKDSDIGEEALALSIQRRQKPKGKVGKEQGKR